jgi:hypothetical protein
MNVNIDYRRKVGLDILGTTDPAGKRNECGTAE